MQIYLGKKQKVEAHHKGFIIKTDQPEKAGGDNEYPAPFDIFLASIATCAGFYVKSFCQQRNIPDDEIKLELKTHKNNDTGIISKIDIDIYLPEDFPEKYKQAVLKSAEQCSVKKHIFNPPEFMLNAYIG